MILMKWDPFRDLILLRDRVNKLFEESLSKVDLRDAALSFGAWLPAVDIFETRDTIVVKVEVPGMDKNEFFVSIKNNNLIIKGERGIKKGKKEEHYMKKSIIHFSFSFLKRSITASLMLLLFLSILSCQVFSSRQRETRDESSFYNETVTAIGHGEFGKAKK